MYRRPTMNTAAFTRIQGIIFMVPFLVHRAGHSRHYNPATLYFTRAAPIRASHCIIRGAVKTSLINDPRITHYEYLSLNHDLIYNINIIYHQT